MCGQNLDFLRLPYMESTVITRSRSLKYIVGKISHTGILSRIKDLDM